MNNSVLGERLRSLREGKGWTQLHAAKIFGITNGALSNYERGYREPDAKLLNKLSEVYGCSVDYLLGRSDTRKTTEQQIESAISDEPELIEFFQDLKLRDDLQLLFKQVKPLPPEAIKRIIKYVKMVEDEEAQED